MKVIVCILLGFLIPSCSSLNVRSENIPKDASWSETENAWITVGNNGEVKSWYKNGVLYYLIHVENGDVKTKEIWYPNGVKKTEVIIKNGLLNGIVKAWYDNGNKMNEGFFINDHEEGEWLYWRRDGSFVGKVWFSKGEEIRREEAGDNKK